ncbi:MAG: CBS domain-containing protein [Roseiarcus sp.]|jgi:CBS domain-containing protein
MRVRDAMTRGVVGVRETANLSEAVETMLRARISALFVFDERKALIGVLSEGDLLRRGELGTETRRPRWLETLMSGGRLAQSYAHAHGRKVSEVMTKSVVSIGEDANLAEAVDLMIRRRVKRLPVVRGGSVVGVLSRSDLLRRLYLALPRDAAPKSDDEICAAIRAEIESQAWAPRASIRVSAKDGEVTFDGAITDERLRDGLRVIAENTPGVKAIHDRLAWIEPNSGVLIPAHDDTET